MKVIGNGPVIKNIVDKCRLEYCIIQIGGLLYRFFLSYNTEKWSLLFIYPVKRSSNTVSRPHITFLIVWSSLSSGRSFSLI